ncbi:unnamed protein product [Schistosoma curassoni]|uniref:IQ domain-containing protein G n=1 Tax=Schistosoma curassoni TaxID=6186 RepID=A0A183KFA1_9TREM|nr:unnamed protein product [Schistosoma curassoni]
MNQYLKRENKPDPSGERNQEEPLEVDRTHIEERTQLCHKASPQMESSRPNEKRNSKEHITPRNGDRLEKNEQKLDRTEKESPGTEWVGECWSAFYAPLGVTGLNGFRITLNNRFQALHDELEKEESAMKDNWWGIKQQLTSTYQEVLGLKKHHHKEWISVETRGKIQEGKNKKKVINNSRKKAEKVKTQAECTETNKRVKKSLRADK